ncbi:hypothetical protein SPF06_19775 [Sinomonas sp. JGH33]|uniref:Uncharacterized protein n=1 Tax=Sinomonas terricola TaxID=3110330 RepID=A0ABU5TBJ7_9MICC|nr:hypothetical protein [Sinomonas sp. JGH33]MEA5456968.1 hypothetical protein [Sinomonas sp. JGH33]
MRRTLVQPGHQPGGVVDELRAERSADAPLSAPQARAERIAQRPPARNAPEHAAGEHSEAVRTALEKIKAKRDAEQAAGEEAARDLDDQTRRRDRGGPGIGH